MWHAMSTARGRMLEYTLELEAKIAEAKLSVENTRFVMAFRGEGGCDRAKRSAAERNSASNVSRTSAAGC